MNTLERLAAGDTGRSVLDVLDLGVVTRGRTAQLAVVVEDAGPRPRLRVTDRDRVEDARVGDGAVTALVRVWRAGGDHGLFETEWRAGPAATGAERAVSTDHANLSVATGEVLVKLLRRPAPTGVTTELIRHLEAVGFSEAPRPLGTLSWRGPDGARVLALASRYVSGAEEGWGRFRRLAEEALRRDGDVRAGAGAIADLGALIARFHLAVATPSGVLETPVRDSTSEDRRGWVQRAQTTLDAALAEVGGAAGRRLRDHALHLRRLSGTLEDGGATPLVRVHGDLHVGQVLTSAGELHLTDLDGDPYDPARSAAEAPAARDLAALLRSLDHVGRLAARRRGGADERRVDRWIASARAACRATYTETLDAHGGRHLLDDALVHGFEAGQVVHELRYAVGTLPGWLPIADAALSAFVEGRATDGP